MREHYFRPSDNTLLTILNDKICEGAITGVIFRNFDGRFLVDGYKFKHNGELFILSFDKAFYYDEECIKRNVCMEPDNNDKHFEKISGCANPNYTLYYLKNGRIEPWVLSNNVKRYMLDKNLNVCHIDGFVPEKLYKDEAEFYFHNDLIIHKDNGDIEIQDAPIKKILLNDRQKELFDQFKALLKEMNEANMLVITNHSDDSIGVINRPSGCDWAGTYGYGSKCFWEIIPDEQCEWGPNDIWSVSEEWEIRL